MTGEIWVVACFSASGIWIEERIRTHTVDENVRYSRVRARDRPKQTFHLTNSRIREESWKYQNRIDE